jgi:hypothetical protein
MKTISKKQLRTVTILVRYFIKATQAVVLYVENDKGARYYTRLQENGVHTCNCKATKECYHIKACVASEQARKFAAKSLPTWAVKLVNTGKIEVPGKSVKKTPVAKIIEQAVSAKVPTPKKDMMKAALTTNKGFQLMR